MAFNPKFIRTFAPKISNTYVNEKKNTHYSAIFSNDRQPKERLHGKANEKKSSK